MAFTKEFQDQLVAALLEDSSFLHAVMAMLPSSTFLSPLVRRLVKNVYDFYSRYGEAPKEHLNDWLVGLRQSGQFIDEDFQVLSQYLAEIAEVKYNAKYLLSTVGLYAKRQNVKGALLQAAPLVESGTEEDLKKARRLVEDAFSVADGTYESGTDILSQKYMPPEKYEVDFKFNIPEIDRALGGLRKREICYFHGVGGVGKSWALCYCGREACMQGMDVIHLTGEMDKNEVWMRQAQSTGSLTKMKLDRTRGWDAHNKCFKIIERPQSISSISNVQRALSDLRSYGGKYIVKEFLSGQFTVRDMEAYLASEVKRQELQVGRMLIIVDYDDLLGFDKDYGEHRRFGTEDKYLGFLRIAQKFDAIVLTAVQANRPAEDAKWLTQKHLAEDISKYRHSHVAISLNQSQDEYNKGEMRLLVYKNRNGPRFQRFTLYQNFEIGQFCLCCERLRGVASKEIEDASGQS